MNPEVQQTPTPKPKRIGLWVSAGLIVVLAIGGGAYALGQQRAKVTATPSPKIVTVTASPTPTAKATATVSQVSNPPVTDDGVTWLDSPQKITTVPKLFKDASLSTGQNPITYYKVGTDKGKDIIIATVPPEGPGDDMFLMFVKNSATDYDFLTKHSPDAFGTDNKYYAPELASLVKTNNQKLYKSIAPQKQLVVNGITFTAKSGFGSGGFFSGYEKDVKDNGAKLTEYATTPYGKLYSFLRDDKNGVVDNTYILKRPNSTTQNYQFVPTFVKDDGVPQVTWTDGTANGDPYRYDGTGGCGSVDYVSLVSSGSLDGLVKAGTTNENEAIYAFKDTSNSVVQAYYKIMDGKYYDSAKNDYVAISLDDFLAKHGLFVYKDPLNRLIVFSSQVYGPQVECGKPVVYLYPTKPTQVSVKVGADITVSDPTYNNGWNVTAKPDGTLTNSDGKQYDSLFWEGTGKEYPSITQGFVVPQAQLESTLRDHLAKLGLNGKESNDFMAFWLPKMPMTPYVRLTWFGTQQMDRLAPLTISPKPDSVIRIFLDFQGLGAPVNLPPQRLTAIPRQGFTAVEWGGLLRK